MGRNIQVVDAAANDSDKTFTLPGTQHFYKLHYVYVTLVTTATAGNRAMGIEYSDDNGVVARIPAGAVQAASLTYEYSFGLGAENLTAVIVIASPALSLLTTPLPEISLPPAGTIRVFDMDAIAAAADDMTVRLAYEPLEP